MADVYRKVGRGGAGNYYTQEQVERAEKAKAADDLEAQKTNTPGNNVPVSREKETYARGGRGGAGNFHDPATLPSQAEQDAAIDEARSKAGAAAAAAAGQGRSGMAHTGRGGAGNWTTVSAGAADELRTEEVQRQEALERKVVEDVEAGLAVPARAHTHWVSEGKEEQAS